VAILLLNAFVGFFQEYQAGGVIDSLKSTLALKAVVLRDSKEEEIMAKDLVPGDIVRIKEGDVVPADCRLIGEGAFLQCDQSSLTGESLAVSKNPGDSLFASCPVKRGTASALVVTTGSKTFIGRSAQLVTQAGGLSHFRQILDSITGFLVGIDLLGILIMFIQGFYRNQSIVYLLVLTDMLTVVAVPIALPAVTTTTLAVGASLLAQKKAIVSKLTAIESLAGVEILCSDKTGTLTKNKLTVNDPVYLKSRTTQEMFLSCAFAGSCLHKLNEAKSGRKPGERITDGMDAIDKAIFKSLKKYNIDKAYIANCKSIDFQPFDPVTKVVTSLVEDPSGRRITATKGAVQSVLKLVEKENGEPYDEGQKADYARTVEEFASRGFRSLGVAMKPSPDEKWVLVGVLPLFDPPRDDSAQTIATAQKMGVRVKMLTGDQLAIAKETGHQLKMGTNMFDASRLEWTEGTGAELADCKCSPLCVCFSSSCCWRRSVSGGKQYPQQISKMPTDLPRCFPSTSTRWSRSCRGEGIWSP